MRACEICSGTPAQLLHQQAFLSPGDKRFNHYDVVCCDRCGFVYADNIPSAAEQEAYYESSGRHIHATNVPPGLAAAHRDFFGFVTASQHLDSAAAILDVGSSMGHFLNLFKTAGFSNIQGLEPSAMASELAKSTYGIDVVAATLEDFHPARSFDLITLCGVLEHLVSLSDTVSRIKLLLSDRGHLFIAVPDAASFGERPPREPFLEFAPEHINFFTEQSLDNLLRPHGLKRVASTSQWNDFYANRYLLALYACAEMPDGEPLRDESGPDSVRRYIDLSNVLLASVAEKIDALAASGEPVIVWGAGSLASRLCATTRLPECKLLGFVDANPQLRGQTLLDISIHAPEWINGHRDAAILIASYVYGEEIRRTLVDKFNWQGRIVTL